MILEVEFVLAFFVLINEFKLNFFDDDDLKEAGSISLSVLKLFNKMFFVEFWLLSKDDFRAGVIGDNDVDFNFLENILLQLLLSLFLLL